MPPTSDSRAGRKSTFSTENGNCVVVAMQHDHVLVWDSKDPGGPALRFTPGEYVAFWRGVLNREFDPPADWLDGAPSHDASGRDGEHQPLR
ncbi:hypothetical protein Sme01_38820 [Sphaerisporangium melleum]|uniref:DUF397 domain-containing protein n=1 Tax=Sphaerisporangium melleum TaxID=321316 RepID=A0A917R3R0_9ACTN|nr:DUF397 domain-containing protein [Sphaerisporangium melleum]GGK85633.1 hypothetical protein GCM10007964_30230 [Sphaerisporangium melleum]GII71406.1 hypothetical protein Sme01_38820 [Sphaerisporangium melleum]